MRFVHISDSHLGAQTFTRKLSPSGINQREEDICNSFSCAIDKIIELKPDFVLHSGDLFHSVRPTNRIVHFGIQQLLKLSKTDIPLVIISGNHDTPKQTGVGSVFRLFTLFDGIYPVYQDKYEKITIKNSAIHAIPHCVKKESFQEELEKIKIDSAVKHNILMLHGVVAGIPEFSRGELSEQEISSSYFKKGFDYVALGHYHRFCQVEENVYYSGSTERLSISELGEEKGFIQVNLENKETRMSQEIKFHQVPTREMIELTAVDAASSDQDDIYKRIEQRISSNDIKEKIVRLKVKNIDPSVYNSLNFRKIAELKKEAFYFDLKLERKEYEGKALSEKPSIGKLNREFEEYVKSIVIEGLDKNKILEMGLEYLFKEEVVGDRE
ncbi:MAG: hypothetical protein AMJ90_09490 [candidate division Zixibacteria bacterium SM23_73_2]|nr:MAG: hypothetical protein AMJ90_09490 [candidate division Zixibacteria bacterium SM23_73_2]ODS38549.1 MAG: hypothetical protein A7315_12215 [Candidatus Altiarchaeales archaeon WOR_SM1_79]